MLRRAVFVRGEEAARVFYDAERFRRRDALPRRGLKSFRGREVTPSDLIPQGGGDWVDAHARLHRFGRESLLPSAPL
jgi:hypothetical protein